MRPCVSVWVMCVRPVGMFTRTRECCACMSLRAGVCVYACMKACVCLLVGVCLCERECTPVSMCVPAHAMYSCGPGAGLPPRVPGRRCPPPCAQWLPGPECPRPPHSPPGGLAAGWWLGEGAPGPRVCSPTTHRHGPALLGLFAAASPWQSPKRRGGLFGTSEDSARCLSSLPGPVPTPQLAQHPGLT